jgi:hypothetical protein
MLYDFDEIKKILNFKFDKKIDLISSLRDRLVYITAFNRSTEFVERFNFSREIKNDIRQSVMPVIERMSPQRDIDKNTKKIIKMIYPEINDSALTPSDILKIRSKVNEKNLADAILKERKKPFLRKKI